MKNNNSGFMWIVAIVVIVLVGALLLYVYSPSGTTPNPTSTTGTTDTSGNTTDTSGTGVATTNSSVPVVTTAAFATVTSTTAIVAGTVTPNGAPTTYWFEYGLTSAFGSNTGAFSAGSGSAIIGEAAYIQGLTPGKQYSFRIGAKNSHGQVYGGVYSFITPSK